MGEVLYLSPSMLRSIATCDTQALLRTQGYTGLEPNLPALAGKWTHAQLAFWLENQWFKDRGGEHWIEMLGDSGFNGDLDEEYTPTNLIAVMNEWEGRNANVLPVKVKEIEVPFDLHFGTWEGTEVRLIGVLDAIGQSAADGKPAIVEHKTTRSRLDAKWKRRFRFDPQPSSYLWAANRLLDTQVDECFVNAIQLKKVPDSNRRCPKHAVAYAECGPQHLEMGWFPVERTPEQLEEFHAEAMALAADYYRVIKLGDPTRSRVQGQFEYDACTGCEFFSWCAGGRRDGSLLAKRERNDGLKHSGLEAQ